MSICKRMMLMFLSMVWVFPIQYVFNANVAHANPNPKMEKISIGNNHTLAIRESDKTVWAWGYGGDGRLGYGGTDTQYVPVKVQGLTDVVAVAAGGVHSLALRSDGTVWAWGRNESGQLGDGTTQSRSIPVPVANLTNVVAISAGNLFSMALKSDGTVWAWGNNEYGQLGDGTIEYKTTPVRVSNLTDVVAISAGGGHALALKSDGTIWAWGHNEFGQLGDGNTTYQVPTPIRVPNLTGVVSIATGGWHSMAIDNQGRFWIWGRNIFGEIGDGTSQNLRTSPVHLSNFNNVIAMEAGYHHTLILMSDGTVWSCGYNALGQLGNGSTSDSATPVRVSNLANVVAIAAGEHQSLVLKSDGTAWTWGNNKYGKLGLGDTQSRSVPTKLLVDPKNIQHTSHSTSISLTWDDFPFAQGYNVYVNGVKNNAAPLLNASYNIPYLDPNTSYSIEVSSFDFTDEIKSPVMTISTGPLDIPNNIQASSGVSNIRVSWDAVDYADGYNIYLNGSKLDTTSNTSYDITGLAPETVYTIELSTLYNGHESGRSAPITVNTLSMEVPSNVQTQVGTTTIQVTWDPVYGVDGYNVYLDGQLVDNINDTFYEITGLKPNKLYSIEISSVYGQYESEKVSTTATTLPLEAPTNVQAAAGATSIFVQWDPILDAKEYKIYVDGEHKGTARDASYQISGLTMNTLYRISVSAVYDVGESDPSDEIEVTTLPDIGVVDVCKTVQVGINDCGKHKYLHLNKSLDGGIFLSNVMPTGYTTIADAWNVQ